MTYIFRGRLCGYICAQCPEPLAGIVVRLYRSRTDQNVTALATASAKDTFAILTGEQVKAKAGSLLAETTVDDNGNFTFELADKLPYNGEAFEIDVYCGTVPHLKPGPKPPAPVQASVTTLQPAWKRSENQAVAVWEYCIPTRYWCLIRGRLGAWTICGMVRDCKTKAPIANVRVLAFDVDWLQDDPLGSALTDAAGKFRIDYTVSDFTKTPFSFLNIEWVGGPDIYFRVETPGGTPLLVEPRTRGRAPDRENAGPCFCVDLCIEGGVPPQGNPTPLFTHVGQYHVDPIYGDFTADGLTTAGNLAFTSTIPLRGLLPNGDDPDALEYRFRIGEYSGGILGAVSDVDATRIAPTVIGQLEYFDFTGVGFVLRSADYWANNPGAPVTTIHRDGMPDINVQLNQPVKPGGWIEVPRQNNLSPNAEGLYVGGFVDMARLDTTKMTVDSFDVTAPTLLKAGDAVPAAVKPPVHTYKIFFEARKVGIVALVSSNARDQITFSNTSYKQQHHPDWAGFVNTQTPVALIDVKELMTNGCGGIGNHVHVLHTVFHPYTGSVTVYLEGPTPPPLPAPINPPIAPDGESSSGSAGHDFDLTASPKCAYIAWLRVTLRLTVGYGPIPPDYYDHVAFCKV